MRGGDGRTRRSRGCGPATRFTGAWGRFRCGDGPLPGAGAGPPRRPSRRRRRGCPRTAGEPGRAGRRRWGGRRGGPAGRRSGRRRSNRRRRCCPESGPGTGSRRPARAGCARARAPTADCARQGIRVNAVAPGVVRTPGSEPYFEAGPEFAALVARSPPLGRPGRAAEVAEAAAWLLSDRASCVAGVTLPVDGGITAVRRSD
ncbi:SDR family oxidoreductase [Kitasatospora aureofaciens]|uniref:SDR family oxidoreductase n=1 Tax=Kitasatospora aureofaciens TaxID=1894 RepID=UPI0037C8B70C